MTQLTSVLISRQTRHASAETASFPGFRLQAKPAFSIQVAWAYVRSARDIR
jgi:hypothetical protein